MHFTVKIEKFIPVPGSQRSIIHVIIQFASIAGILILQPGLPSFWLTYVFALSGIILGMWAILVMDQHNRTIFPEPSPYGEIICKGPYRIIRHPMYTALFLFLIPLSLDPFSMGQIIILGVFLMNQWLKICLEEKLLRKVYLRYPVYMKETKRILPFLL